MIGQIFIFCVSSIRLLSHSHCVPVLVASECRKTGIMRDTINTFKIQRKEVEEEKTFKLRVAVKVQSVFFPERCLVVSSIVLQLRNRDRERTPRRSKQRESTMNEPTKK